MNNVFLGSHCVLDLSPGIDKLRFVLGSNCLMECLTTVPNVKFET